MDDHDTPDSLLDALATTAGLSPADTEEIKQVIQQEDSVAVPPNLLGEAASAEEETTDMRILLAGMTVPQKIKLAMFGNSTCRKLLIADGNRMIREFVLRNPQLQEREVIEFTRNPQLDEGLLRAIADSRKWVQSYAVKYNLVTNPKTPPDVALKWLRYLNDSDLKKLSRSKNVPNLVAVTAQKRIEGKK